MKLFIRKGTKLTEVTAIQASQFVDALRESTGLGASQLGSRPLKLYNIDGQQVGFVSYNGRVWMGTADNRKEIPLCAS